MLRVTDTADAPRLLRAPGFRPSLALDRQRERIRTLAAERGIPNIRVFGSAARGDDGFDSDVERRGLSTTRNVSCHVGYAAMDEEEFWITVTDSIPQLLAGLGLPGRKQ